MVAGEPGDGVGDGVGEAVVGPVFEVVFCFGDVDDAGAAEDFDFVAGEWWFFSGGEVGEFGEDGEEVGGGVGVVFGGWCGVEGGGGGGEELGDGGVEAFDVVGVSVGVAGFAGEEEAGGDVASV